MNTQKELVYQVINNLTGGLKATTNLPFSEQQIADEMDLLRLELFRNSKQRIDFTACMQSVSCVEVVTIEEEGRTLLRTKERMPALFTPPSGKMVDYIGAADFTLPYSVISPAVYPYEKYKKYVFPRAVYVNGYFFLLHLPLSVAKIGIRAIFEKPSQVFDAYYGCCPQQTYPLPGELASLLVRTMVATYQQYGYFRLPEQANTQTFKPTAS